MKNAAALQAGPKERDAAGCFPDPLRESRRRRGDCIELENKMLTSGKKDCISTKSAVS